MYHEWQSWWTTPEIWSATDRMECNGQNFLSFFFTIFALLPPNNQENQNEENTWRYQHFTNVYHKWQSYGIWFLRYGTWWTECFALLDHFCPFTAEKSKFWKYEKNTWRYNFTKVYQISWSYATLSAASRHFLGILFLEVKDWIV